MSETIILESPASSSSPSPSTVGDTSSSEFLMPPLQVMANAPKPPSIGRRESRRVTFHEKRTERYIESISSLSEADRKLLWYSEEDVEICKGKAREISEGVKQGRVVADIRGLELRLSPHRQRRKYMIVHAILKAQKRYTDPNQLSNIARKCTVWSKTVAAIAAQHDYCSLYRPERVSSIASLPPLEKFPLPFKQSKEASAIPIKRPRSPIPQNSHVRTRPAPFALSC